MLSRLFFLLLFCPLLAYTQKEGNSCIVVPVPDTTNLFSRLTTHLYERSYLLAIEDASTGFVETEEKALPKAAAVYKLAIQINRHALIFSALLRNRSGSFHEVKFNRNSNTLNRQAWNAAEEIAKEFGEKLEYE